jgi:hypothetical protein
VIKNLTIFKKIFGIHGFYPKNFFKSVVNRKEQGAVAGAGAAI